MDVPTREHKTIPLTNNQKANLFRFYELKMGALCVHDESLNLNKKISFEEAISVMELLIESCNLIKKNSHNPEEILIDFQDLQSKLDLILPSSPPKEFKSSPTDITLSELSESVVTFLKKKVFKDLPESQKEVFITDTMTYSYITSLLDCLDKRLTAQSQRDDQKANRILDLNYPIVHVDLVGKEVDPFHLLLLIRLLCAPYKQTSALQDLQKA